MVRIFKIDCTLFFQKGRQEICSQVILDDTKGKKIQNEYKVGVLITRPERQRPKHPSTPTHHLTTATSATGTTATSWFGPPL